MTGQTDTVVRKRRALIAVGVLLLALARAVRISPSRAARPAVPPWVVTTT